MCGVSSTRAYLTTTFIIFLNRLLTQSRRPIRRLDTRQSKRKQAEDRQEDRPARGEALSETTRGRARPRRKWKEALRAKKNEAE